jgi:hypothetical protein
MLTPLKNSKNKALGMAFDLRYIDIYGGQNLIRV